MKRHLENSSLLLLHKAMRMLALSGLALSLVLSLVLTIAPASAATIVVMNTNDAGAGSLRAAIAAANAAGGDTIEFILPANSTIALTATLTVDKDLTIDGSGSSGLAISGGNQVGVFGISMGVEAVFSNLAIKSGLASFGGGIHSMATKLTLINCTVSGNYATHNGGGIVNDGNLVLIDSTVSGNSTGGGHGGGIANGMGSLTLTNSTVSGNIANSGGGISSVGTVTLTDSTVTGNTVSSNAGGGGHGGGISSGMGSLTLTNSTVSGNTASGNGGGIVSDTTVVLTGSTISGNTGGGVGGGVAVRGSLTVTDSTVSGNTASYGGGIDNLQGTTTLTNSVVTNNTGNVHGGGISNGIGTLVLTNSTVSGNTTSGNGGGIISDDTLTLTGCAVFGNQADLGGGIANGGALTLTNSTVSGNQAITSGGGIHNNPSTPQISATLTNVTLVGNIGGGFYNAAALADARLSNTIVQACGGNPVTDNGGNLDGSAGCGFTAADSNATFNLGSLADNGGPTLTMMPNTGSPAIGHGVAATCAAQSVDQRGASRLATACTSGAVEFDAAPPTFRLTVGVVGNGSVSENAASPQIAACTTTGSINCTSLYATSANVTLTATPASGYTFTGWSGDCSGASPTTVTMSQARTCSAQFAQLQARLTGESIPTLDRWALLLLGMLAAGIAFQGLWTRNRRAEIRD
ncbi:MAG: hypothetical protein LBE75_09010 [Burkholderiales bacterium]|jgi:uncharacterized repeat protein (TIGR02543 family)|nr:hypothetical protein [Burkholderiales bacterium]